MLAHALLHDPVLAPLVATAPRQMGTAASGDGLHGDENLRRGLVEGQALLLVEASHLAQATLGRG